MSATSSAKSRSRKAAATPVREDVFAQIGQGAASAREKLFAPKPLPVPDIKLPIGNYRAGDDFKGVPPVRTTSQFQQELAKERRAMAPYLRRFAPKPKVVRWKQVIPSARWRITAGSDGKPVKNRWTKVNLPHYGAPTGKATTYYEWDVTLSKKQLTGQRLFLCFKGADYKAQVYCNGTFLCAHEGFFEPFDVDITDVAKPGRNAFRVRLDNDAISHGTGADGDGEKIYAATGLGWDEPGVGWHHCPPGMGLYQEVYLESRPALHVADCWVRPLPQESRAEVTVIVRSHERAQIPVSLGISIFGRNFKAALIKGDKPAITHKAGPGQTQFRFSYPLPGFKWWTPETPWLYEAQVSLLDAKGKAVDTWITGFGMRTFEISEQGAEKGRLLLNGSEIRLRGANTMGHEQQCVLHKDWKQLHDDILIARMGGLNFLRLTQRPVQKEIYEACDALGMMVQTDLPLFGKLARPQFCEAVRQAGAMERLIRPHPSCILSSYINEPFPIAWGDTTHRHLTRVELEAFFVAANAATHLENSDRQIKAVDGDYDPPGPGLPDNHCYCGWYVGHAIDLGKLNRGYWVPVKKGWRYACGEFGAEGLESGDLMRRRYPKSWLPASKGEAWTPSRIVFSQTWPMRTLWMDDNFTTMEDWIEMSQRHQAWSVRMMTRAFRRDPRMVSFAIHLLIDAFPAGWMKTLVDCERNPKKAFFEYRDALQPLLVDFRTDRWAWSAGETFTGEIWICNDRNDAPKGMQVRYVIETDEGSIASGHAPVRVGALDSLPQGTLRFALPKVTERTNGRIRVGLFAPGAKTPVNETVEPFTIFPAPDRTKTSSPICLLDGGKSAAKRLLGEMKIPGAVRAPRADDLIVASDAKAIAKALPAVRAGATLLLLELPVGEHRIGDETVKVEVAGFSPRHFVSRASGHPLVAGFEPNDFRFWFDPSCDSASPLLDTLFHAENWTPILLTSQSGWGCKTSSAHACAEKTFGKGRVIICQTKLAGRTSTNPTAHLFSQRLLVG